MKGRYKVQAKPHILPLILNYLSMTDEYYLSMMRDQLIGITYKQKLFLHTAGQPDNFHNTPFPKLTHRTEMEQKFHGIKGTAIRASGIGSL